MAAFETARTEEQETNEAKGTILYRLLMSVQPVSCLHAGLQAAEGEDLKEFQWCSCENQPGP